MVVIEKLPDGGYHVSRVFPTLAATRAGAMALERIVPEAYQPGAPTPTGLCGVQWLNPPSDDAE